MSVDTDPLWRYIHDIVNERVPPEHRAAVTDLVARTTVHILTTPEFLYGLRIVQELQHENAQLRHAVMTLQARPRKAPAKKRAPVKAVAKKAAPRKTATAKNTRAFKQGRSGR